MTTPNDYRMAKAHQERLLQDAEGARRPQRPNRLLALLRRLFRRGEAAVVEEVAPADGKLPPLQNVKERAGAEA